MQIQTIVDSCQKTMKRPVLLLDAHYCPVACATAPENATPLEAPAQDQLDPRKNAPYLLSGKNGRRILAANLICGQAIAGYLFILEGTVPFQPQDMEFAGVICLALIGAMTAEGSAQRAYTRESLVLDLLHDKQVYPEIINQKTLGLQLDPAKQYQVLAIDGRFYQADDSLHGTLSEMLHTELYVYECFFVAILQSDKYQSYHRQDFSELLRYMQERDLYAGLSQGFDNIAELRQFFLQSVKSMELGVHCYQNIRFYRYEDYITSHMLEICKEKTDLLNFCHPAVVRIHKYDQEHGTNYLRTLGVYIYSGHNMQKSAKILFVHRNTLYHHIVRLREEFGINFEDWRLHFRLMISLIVYNYLNILDLSEFT